MLKLINDYKNVIPVSNCDLLAVQMIDGGWTVADGYGISLTPDDEIELAGWHLPVRFETSEKAIAAITTGPHAIFDIASDSTWALHAIDAGGIYDPNYTM